MIDLEEKKEQLVLFAVATSSQEAVDASLDELEELCDTAGGECVGRLVQNLDRINPGTYLGSGKVEELKELVYELGATGVVCDDELSPAQLRNLEDLLRIKVMDRTLIILDIFAMRAQTSEGKIQVELAQLRYRATRLVGLRSSLSRQEGGYIGTRGPGEKKLELDRRLIHQRIGLLKEELDQVIKHRDTARKSRQNSYTKVAAIVGYTNAGKSTLLNTLTQADILAEDKLFATLDPTTRMLSLPSGEEILLTDTVGFINKLPHHLIDAFKSTLEEAKYADIILHVVDASDPLYDAHMHVVYDTLHQLGVEDKIVITLFNKQDVASNCRLFKDFKADYSLPISAKTGDGLEELQNLLDQILRSQKIYFEKVFSYGDAGMIQQIRANGQVVTEEYGQDGIHVTGYVPADLYGKLIGEK